MFTLASPWVLLFLPLPLLIYWRLPTVERKSSGVLVPFYQELATSVDQQKQPSQRAWLRLLLLTIIWCLVVLAAARPQWLGDPEALPTSGRDLLLAVDISDSMSQEDMQVNNRAATRLAAVKEVVSEFIDQRKGDRIGLILFGTNAYLQTPLTFDTGSVKQFLQEAQLGFAGPQTAIGDAIGLAVKRLKQRDEQAKKTAQKNNTSNIQLAKNKNSHVIILLTDGANTAGEVEPLQAAQLAKQIDSKIYTIGMGADEMTVRSFFGSRKINPSASLDEGTLQAIADTTQGQYFRARNTQELNNIYQELDKLEPIEQEKEWLRPIRSLFMWPLGFALILTLFLAIACQWYALTEYLNKHFVNPSTKATTKPATKFSPKQGGQP